MKVFASYKPYYPHHFAVNKLIRISPTVSDLDEIDRQISLETERMEQEIKEDPSVPRGETGLLADNMHVTHNLDMAGFRVEFRWDQPYTIYNDDGWSQEIVNRYANQIMNLEKMAMEQIRMRFYTFTILTGWTNKRGLEALGREYPGTQITEVA